MKKTALRLATIIVLCLVLAFSVAACSSKSSSDNYSGSYPNVNESTGDTSVSETKETSPDRKIIYTAYASITVDDIGAKVKELAALLKSDEWEASSNISENSATVTYRIKTSRLDEFVSSLDGIGDVYSYNKTSEDISIYYNDNVAKKATLEAEYVRLTELLASAQNVSDVLTINKRLSEIETELQQINGTLNSYDSLIEYSQVTVSLYTEYSADNSFGAQLKEAFGDGWEFAKSLLIFVIVAIPFIAVIGGIVVGIIFLIKKIKRARRVQKHDSDPTPPTK